LDSLEHELDTSANNILVGLGVTHATHGISRYQISRY